MKTFKNFSTSRMYSSKVEKFSFARSWEYFRPYKNLVGAAPYNFVDSAQLLTQIPNLDICNYNL